MGLFHVFWNTDIEKYQCVSRSLQLITLRRGECNYLKRVTRYISIMWLFECAPFYILGVKLWKFINGYTILRWIVKFKNRNNKFIILIINLIQYHPFLTFISMIKYMIIWHGRSCLFRVHAGKRALHSFFNL